MNLFQIRIQMTSSATALERKMKSTFIIKEHLPMDMR